MHSEGQPVAHPPCLRPVPASRRCPIALPAAPVGPYPPAGHAGPGLAPARLPGIWAWPQPEARRFHQLCFEGRGVPSCSELLGVRNQGFGGVTAAGRVAV